MPYMIQIDNKLISDDVVKEHFACDLNACKGACCIAGDGGAPLLKDELSQLEKAYPAVKHLLGEEAVKVIETEGLYVEDEDPLLFYRIIAQLSHDYLKTEGLLFFEINEYLGNDMKQMLEQEGFSKIEIR